MNKNISILRKNILMELGINFFITSFLTFLILKVYKINLRLPMAYERDALFSAYIFKTIHEFGWWFSKNLNVGMPFGSNLYDFSSFYFDSIHFFIAKIILFFVKDWGKTINIFYLTLFPLTSVISYYVMRKLKIGIFLSFWGSLCYTFLSYRFERGVVHIFLSAYYLIPLLVLLCYVLYTDEEVLIIDKKFFQNRKNIYILLFLIVLSLSGIYYSFFSCFFILITFIFKININNIKVYFKKMMVCYFTVAFNMLIVFIPNLIYKITNGNNIEAPNRNPFEAEYYGLRISELMIPKNLSMLFGKFSTKIQENILEYRNLATERTEYLGIIGIIGFFYLLYLLLKKQQNNNLEALLKILNISGILLGVSSGLGTVFAIFISPQIRGYNRISVFIAYFCILAICFKLNEYINTTIINKKIYIFLSVIFIFSIWEQIPLEANYEISNKKYLDEYNNNQKFFSYIENEIGNEGMIFQFPYMKFPEIPPLNNLKDYELFKGYLHSNKLKWSYGGYKGRRSDLWNRYMNTLYIDEMLEKISIVGFNGLYIDKRAYLKEDYKKLENTIIKITRTMPYISDDKNLVFFDLRNYSKKIIEEYSKEEYQKQKDKILNTIVSTRGIYENEQENSRRWRWTEKNFEIIIFSEKENLESTLQANIFSEYPENSELIIDYNKQIHKIIVNNKGTELKLNFDLKKGENVIKFYTNTKKVIAPNDMRKMYLKFENFKIN